MVSHSIPITPAACGPSRYLGRRWVSLRRLVSVVSRKGSRRPPGRVDPISDLPFLARYLASWLNSDCWSQASLLAGATISSLATALTASPDSRLRDEIREQFCPDRFKGRVRAAVRFRTMDLTIRAVAAHAILARFFACLEYVRHTTDPSRGGRSKGAFAPSDLLAAMARAHAESLAFGAGRRRRPRKQPGRIDDGLFRLVLNEAKTRLEMTKADRLLKKRLRKHMQVFRWLAVRALTAAAECGIVIC